MRFLLDQDVYAVTVRLLRDLGHDTLTASEAGLATAADSKLLQTAVEQQRVLVTRDRDFGGLVFLQKLGAGVIYLHISPATLKASHDELRRALELYSQEQLQKAFITVDPGRHRFRRLDQ